MNPGLYRTPSEPCPYLDRARELCRAALAVARSSVGPRCDTDHDGCPILLSRVLRGIRPACGTGHREMDFR